MLSQKIDFVSNRTLKFFKIWLKMYLFQEITFGLTDVAVW